MSVINSVKVRCTVCAGDKVLSSYKNTTSNFKKTFGVAARYSKTYREAESCDKCRRPPTKTTKTGFLCKSSKWGRVKEVGRTVCCRGNASGQRNVKRHIERKHISKQKDITATSHKSNSCPDIAHRPGTLRAGCRLHFVAVLFILLRKNNKVSYQASLSVNMF